MKKTVSYKANANPAKAKSNSIERSNIIEWDFDPLPETVVMDVSGMKIKEIIDTQPGRIEALRRLTGGVIRTIVLLFEIFIDQKDGSAFSDLEAILDRVTPLYKHRMDDLPAQQQEIVEAIALAWDAINVSEISQKTRIISKTVSAQLRQMEKNEIDLINKNITEETIERQNLEALYKSLIYIDRV